VFAGGRKVNAKYIDPPAFDESYKMLKISLQLLAQRRVGVSTI
jgi:hypothetical protein